MAILYDRLPRWFWYALPTLNIVACIVLASPDLDVSPRQFLIAGACLFLVTAQHGVEANAILGAAESAFFPSLLISLSVLFGALIRARARGDLSEDALPMTATADATAAMWFHSCLAASMLVLQGLVLVLSEAGLSKEDAEQRNLLSQQREAERLETEAKRRKASVRDRKETCCCRCACSRGQEEVSDAKGNKGVAGDSERRAQ